MKRFLISLILFLSPILLLLGIYFIKDPYKVLYNYSIYSGKTSVPQLVTGLVGLDADYVSTQLFINNCPKYQYHSFILGNSCSKNYFIDEWNNHIKDVKHTNCFHWDASGETIFGVEKKLNYLDKKNIYIKDALIILSVSSLLGVEDQPEHLYIKHYALTGKRFIDFQGIFLKDFFDPEFLEAYIYYLITNRIRQRSIDNYIFNNPKLRWKYDVVTNESVCFTQDSIIAADKTKYYDERKGIFYKQDSGVTYFPKVITQKQIELLTHIKSILDKNNTNYKIVISPAYDQKKIDTTDLHYLQQLFGKDHLFDFTGRNEFSQSKYNFYEIPHYRPFISSRIMNIIYSGYADDSIKNLMR